MMVVQLRHAMQFRFVGLLILTWLLGKTSDASAQTASFERPPINYMDSEANDAVAQLIASIESGESQLEFNEDNGYLSSVLSALDIPIESQVLVFSKTSMQVRCITPKTPRAVYFNDDVYVGWCQKGDVLEISATDAQLGPVFYSIKQEAAEKPLIIRDQGQCIVCHASSRTQNVPGLFIRSVFANRSGNLNFGSGSYTTDMTSPFKQRWGGWYVTGTHGEMRHMGNKTFRESERHENLDDGANVETLSDLVDTSPYLMPHSDLVALLVLEHQVQMHNALTFANYQTRRALHDSYEMNELLERPKDFLSETSKSQISRAADRVVQHLLMCDEFVLESAITGTSGFDEQFAQRGPQDKKGRSLRDFDLETRIFKYPCSYLIYSEQFDGLPDILKQEVIAKLLAVLEGDDSSKRFAHLDAATRQAILEILRDTSPSLFASEPTPVDPPHQRGGGICISANRLSELRKLLTEFSTRLVVFRPQTEHKIHYRSHRFRGMYLMFG